MRSLFIALALLAAFIQTTFFASLTPTSVDLLAILVVFALKTQGLRLALATVVSGSLLLEIYSDLPLGVVLVVYLAATGLLVLAELRLGSPKTLTGVLASIASFELVIRLGLVLGLLVSGASSHAAALESRHVWVAVVLTGILALILYRPLGQLISFSTYYRRGRT